jgi:hypothetical protein
MTHLAPDELIDALDGTLAPLRRQHLDTCESCHLALGSLRATLGDVHAQEVPEPLPLFWDQLSTRVRVALHDEPAAPPRRWFEWPVLAPLAGLALLVIALVSTMPSAPPAPDTPLAAAFGDSRDVDAFVAEADWALVAELMSDLDLDAAHDAGLAMMPGSADAALMYLSSAEQQELVRLLRDELRAGS